MELNIYLARHGQDEDNAAGILNGRRDKPLTQIGISQAKELANKIKRLNIKFTKIFSSPLTRACQTAKIIAETLALEKPEKIGLLVERDFGIMTGQPHSRIEEMCSPNILRTKTVNYFLNPKGAETFPDLIKRAKKLLKLLANRYQNGGNILLVTHGDFGKMIYAAYYRLPWKRVLKMFHFGNSDLLLLSPKTKPDQAHILAVKQYNN